MHAQTRGPDADDATRGLVPTAMHAPRCDCDTCRDGSCQLHAIRGSVHDVSLEQALLETEARLEAETVSTDT